MSASRVVLFAFDASQRTAQPCAVVKVCRTLQQNDWIGESVDRLAAMRCLLSPGLATTVPHIVRLGHLDGFVSTAETFLPGEPMRLGTRGNRGAVILRQFSAVSEWLMAFHTQTRSGHLFIDVACLKEDALSALRDSHFSVWETSALVGAIDSLIGYPLPAGWCYGDCNPGNFLIAGDRVSGAVDWGSCRPEASQILDWLDFSFTYALFSMHALGRRGHISLEDAAVALGMLLRPPENRISRLLQVATSRVFALYGLDPRVWEGLVVAFIMTLGHSWDVSRLLAGALSELQNRPRPWLVPVQG